MPIIAASETEPMRNPETPFSLSVYDASRTFLLGQELDEDAWQMNSRKVLYYYAEAYAGHESDRTNEAVLEDMRIQYHSGGIIELASLAAVEDRLITEVGEDKIRYRLFEIAEDNASEMRKKHAREDIDGTGDPNMRDLEVSKIQGWVKLQEDLLKR